MSHGKLGACVGVAFACQVGADLLGVTTTGIPWGTVAAAGFSVGASYLVNLANDFTNDQQKVADWIQNEHIAKLIGSTIGQILEDSHLEFKGAARDFEANWAAWSNFALRDLKDLDTSLIARHLAEANPAIADVRLDQPEDWLALVNWYSNHRKVSLSLIEREDLASGLHKAFLKRLQKNMAFHDVAWKKLLPQMLGEGFSNVNDQLKALYSEVKVLADKFGPTFEPYTKREADSFIYTAELATFRGRESQIMEVGRFLAEPTKKFRWWRITGPAGSGKSRFGLNLLRLLEGQLWFAVRVKLGTGNYKEQWKTWVPSAPTLLVIDYALDYPAETKHILNDLQERSESFAHPVRVITLSRESEGVRWDRFFDSEALLARNLYSTSPKATGFQPMGVEQKLWNQPGTRLRLAELDDEELLSMAGDVWRNIPNAERVDWTTVEHRLTKTLPVLRNLAGASLPLLFQIAAWKASIGGTELTDPETLVSFLLSREVIKWQEADLDLSHRNLAIASTMLGGVESIHPALSQCPQLSNDKTEENLGKLYTLSSGYKSGFRPRIEPDIIGELFVLKSFEKDSGPLKMGVEDAHLQALEVAQHVLEEAKKDVEPFLIRAADSWPQIFKDSVLFQALAPDQKMTAWAYAIESLGSSGDQSAILIIKEILGLCEKLHKVVNSDSRLLLASVCFNGLARDHTSKAIGYQFLENLRKLAKDHPKDDAVRGILAKGLVNAFAGAKGDPEAQKLLLDELRQLAKDHSQDDAVRGILAKGLFNAFNGANGDPKAQKLLLDELKKLAKDHPQDDAVRGELAKGIVNAIADAIGDPEAQKLLLDELRQLAKDHPQEDAVRGELAGGLVNAIAGAGADGDPEAQKLLLEELRQLAKDHPQDPAVRGELAKGLLNAIAGAKGDPEAQKPLLEELRRLAQDHPQDDAVRGELAGGIFNAFAGAKGDPEAQKLLLDELRRLAEDHPQDDAVRDAFNKGLTVAAHLSNAPEETILFINEAVQNGLQGTLDRVPALIPFVQEISGRFIPPKEDADSD